MPGMQQTLNKYFTNIKKYTVDKRRKTLNRLGKALPKKVHQIWDQTHWLDINQVREGKYLKKVDNLELKSAGLAAPSYKHYTFSLKLYLISEFKLLTLYFHKI